MQHSQQSATKHGQGGGRVVQDDTVIQFQQTQSKPDVDTVNANYDLR